nr:hypothetical protein GCM10017745_57860 [Saccharothrix mutabilis subsp. capreolus]
MVRQMFPDVPTTGPAPADERAAGGPRSSPTVPNGDRTMNEDHAAHGRPPDHAADRAAEQQRSLVQAWQRAELSTEELWLRYFGLGGEAGFLDVDAYVHGLGGLAPLERDVLAHAVNERLDELAWSHRAGYSRPYRDSTPRSEPFAALVRLLEGGELAPPDRLPAVAGPPPRPSA